MFSAQQAFISELVFGDYFIFLESPFDEKVNRITKVNKVNLNYCVLDKNGHQIESTSIKRCDITKVLVLSKDEVEKYFYENTRLNNVKLFKQISLLIKELLRKEDYTIEFDDDVNPVIIMNASEFDVYPGVKWEYYWPDNISLSMETYDLERVLKSLEVAKTERQTLMDEREKLVSHWKSLTHAEREMYKKIRDKGIMNIFIDPKTDY